MKKALTVAAVLFSLCIGVSHADVFASGYKVTNPDGTPQFADPEQAPQPAQANRFSSGGSQTGSSFSYGVQMQNGSGVGNFNQFQQFQQAPVMDDKSFFSHVPQP